jgi:regulator of cell morphogenesis and NO signaling
MQNVHQMLIRRSKQEQLITERPDFLPKRAGKQPKEWPLNTEKTETTIGFIESGQDAHFENTDRFTVVRLLSYLKTSHRYYLDKMLPEIEQSVGHISKFYGQSDPMVSDLILSFHEYKKRLIQHILQEENPFYLYVEKLLDAQKEALTGYDTENLLKASPMDSFPENRNAVEEQLEEVRNIILDHSPEAPLPLPCLIFLTQVDLFAMELEKHGIIKDVVFLPMVQQLEMQLTRKN